MEIKNKMFGFFVEKVKEILTSSRDFLQKIKFIPYEGKQYLSGVLIYEGRKLFLPDFKKLLNPNNPKTVKQGNVSQNNSYFYKPR